MSPDCPRCSSASPHQVVARCACGQSSAGHADHIWTLVDHEDGTVTLSPSFNWLVDRQRPELGSHLHEFVRRIRVASISEVAA